MTCVVVVISLRFDHEEGQKLEAFQVLVDPVRVDSVLAASGGPRMVSEEGNVYPEVGPTLFEQESYTSYLPHYLQQSLTF